MYYVHKDSLVEVDRGENGNIILNGWTQTEISQEEFYENYVAVRKMGKSRTTKKKMNSAELDEFIKQSIQFQGLGNQEEDDSYIKGQMELTKNKAF